jgi:hypothetical protein
MKMAKLSSSNATVLSRAILVDRASRRKWLGGLLLFLVICFGSGMTFLAPWLSRSVWRFGIFWLMVLVMVFVVIIFALYDAVAVIREERERMK